MIGTTNDIASGPEEPAPRSFDSISIVSFNIRKSQLSMATVLDKYAGYVDIFLFQEPFWGGVRHQPSTTNKYGDMAYGPLIHQSWTCYYGAYDNRDMEHPRPRVLTYINNRLNGFRPQLRTDIIRHHDVSLVTLHIKKPQPGVSKEFNILNI